MTSFKPSNPRAQIDEELKWIPRGPAGSDQNILRSAYNGVRSHDLSLDPAATAEASLTNAIGIVRRSNPSFVPTLEGIFSVHQ